jgi:mannitol-1-/sugar-/sorbitol-6-/2-deoxyglucose-6-phosphatase
MDGLLIDSEPLWQDAEIEIFGELGFAVTREMCRRTMGMRIDEVVAHWQSEGHLSDIAPEEVVGRVVDRMAELIAEKGVAQEGVAGALGHVESHVDKLAIASSSWMVLIDTVLDSLGLRGHFDEIVSAQDEQRGKPDPAVFLSAARRLGVEPSRCVALEDSLFGVQAAKAAGMTCIAVPLDVPASERDSFHIADLVLSDLTELPARWEELPHPI